MKDRKIIIPKDLLILLILATVLNLGRFSFFDKGSFLFLFWNMFLAFVPFMISSWMVWYQKRPTMYLPFMIAGFIGWLLFFPNAPYLITDLIHTGRVMIVPVFYDLLVLFSSALVGLSFSFYSLSHIEGLIRVKFSKRNTHAILIGILLVSSFGIYLGRFIRFNSWNVVTDHTTLFSKIWAIISRPYAHQEAYLFTAFFFFTIYMLYSAWKHTKPPVID